MNLRFGNFFESLWSRPDPVLADAGVAGELLVAKIRLSLATVLLLIPVINSLFFPVDPKEGLVGLSLTSGTFGLALTMYLLISRGHNSSWLRFASSAFDVTLVSSALALFLLLNQPNPKKTDSSHKSVRWAEVLTPHTPFGMTNGAFSTSCSAFQFRELRFLSHVCRAFKFQAVAVGV
jgi:hypothetical protein